jgi:CHAD domain-containing protein
VLAHQREAALDLLLATMDTPRYRRLLALTIDAAREPQLLDKAETPASTMLPKLVRKPFGHVRRAVEALPGTPRDEQLHALRVKVKRARYAVDASVETIGSEARPLQRALHRLQEVLGDHQDAAVAEAWLRQHVAGLSPQAALAAGELVAAQRSEAAELKTAWPDAWRRCIRPRAVEWLG